MLNKAPFKVAKTQALKSTSRFRVGCVLAKGGRILSVGRNDMGKSHPQIRAYSSFAHLHAEVDACLGLRPYDVLGADAYVYRILADEKPAMAKPCDMCRAVLKKMGIKRVFYTTGEGAGWKMEKIL